ncbi:MAG: glycine dehydrogenase subunit 2 [Planctomycetes bacterium]|nr:glycine dehydrogenase subunit 2 [Planctomycetota bacterium]NOG54205.1 aminomethyl-transferring glycine dehydrogenase subunit GcvPB [Planctomycetota bacterium]
MGTDKDANVTTENIVTATPRGDRPVEPLVFEKSIPGQRAVTLPPLDVPETALPSEIVGGGFPGAEIGQLDLMRHYTHLAQRNFSVDGQFYPLGSCTMKYNPRINEWAASLPGFTGLHPLQAETETQGLLRLLFELRGFLEEIAGLDEVCLQPAAGAHGEYTALKVIRAFYHDHGQSQRNKVLAPDTAHGTNPASCAMCGANVITVPSASGYTDVDALKEVIDREGADTIAAFMITNPNTAGLFDSKITEIAGIMHEAGGMVYLDGANMNAILGKARPGDFGVDAMHYNTHKTFSTPHGCGGPGSGPIAVTTKLAPYLPVPQVEYDDVRSMFSLNYNRPKSIGKVRSFFGQIGVLIRCWAYIRSCGPDGLRDVAEMSVLNANYLASQLHARYETPYFEPGKGKWCAHEFITVPKSLLAHGVTLLDIAKRLIDYGIHPPTMHWPVHDCLMVEPTETESKRTLDTFIDAMSRIADEIESHDDAMHDAPADAPVRRLDEVAASRKPRLTFTDSQ